MTVTGLRRDRHGRVAGVVGRDHTGRPFVVDASLVIGADGMRSSVARHVAAPTERRGTGASAVVYGYWSELETTGYEWVFRPNACAGVIPTNGGLACVFAAASPRGSGAAAGPSALESVLRQACPETAARVRDATLATGVRTFLGQPGFLRRAWGPGWALVGDAGYWKDPLSAHGLTDALRDAELLARAVQGSASGDETESEAFARYQLVRDRLSMPLFLITDQIATQRWTDATIGGLLIRLSASMAEEVDALVALDALAAL